MPLTEHLRELRNRLAKALVALVIATIVCFVFYPQIFDFLKQPYCDLPASVRATMDPNGECTLNFFGILDAFMIRLKVSLIAGAVVSAPVWLYQLWGFITPGLHRHERRWSLAFVGSSLVLFVVGAFFAYLTLSKGLELLLGFGGDGLVSVLDVNKYLSYVIAMLLVFGLSFEIPLIVTMLNLAGVVSTAKLRSWRRPQIFLTFLFAAIVTPSQDPFTLLALGLPMIVLFEVALLIGWLNDRRKRRNGGGSLYADLADDETSPLDLPDHQTAERGGGLSDSGLGGSDRGGSDRGAGPSDGQTVGASAAAPTATKHDDVT